MNNIFYCVPSGSCYLVIMRIKYEGPEYIKAHVRWYSRPGKTYLHEERNLKIPKTCFNFWNKDE